MPVPVDVIRFAFWREEFMKSVKPTDDYCLRIKPGGFPRKLKNAMGWIENLRGRGFRCFTSVRSWPEIEMRSRNRGGFRLDEVAAKSRAWLKNLGIILRAATA